jgi:hypothetical protein
MNMGKRKYFLISIALILCAICADFIALHLASRATYVTAKSMTNKTASEVDRTAARTKSAKLGQIGKVLWLISVGLAALCAAAWYMAVRHREPAWHLLLPGLFVSWCLLQFVMA